LRRGSSEDTQIVWEPNSLYLSIRSVRPPLQLVRWAVDELDRPSLWLLHRLPSNRIPLRAPCLLAAMGSGAKARYRNTTSKAAQPDLCKTLGAKFPKKVE